MSIKNLEIKAALQISKPVSEVFEAIVNPDQMKNYFISKGSGRMEEGKTLMWSFPEFEGEFPIKVGKIEKDKYVSYYWADEGEDLDKEGSKRLLVEITLDAYGENTVVIVTEKSMENNEKGIKWLKGNTEGWANFLACMKAWLEYGIHLRKGAFNFRFDKNYEYSV